MLLLGCHSHLQVKNKQNNMMMSICLAKSLIANAQARLLTYRKDYLIKGVECVRTADVHGYLAVGDN